MGVFAGVPRAVDFDICRKLLGSCFGARFGSAREIACTVWATTNQREWLLIVFIPYRTTPTHTSKVNQYHLFQVKMCTSKVTAYPQNSYRGIATQLITVHSVPTKQASTSSSASSQEESSSSTDTSSTTQEQYPSTSYSIPTRDMFALYSAQGAVAELDSFGVHRPRPAMLNDEERPRKRRTCVSVEIHPMLLFDDLLLDD